MTIELLAILLALFGFFISIAAMWHQSNVFRELDDIWRHLDTFTPEPDDGDLEVPYIPDTKETHHD